MKESCIVPIEGEVVYELIGQVDFFGPYLLSHAPDTPLWNPHFTHLFTRETEMIREKQMQEV